MQHNVAWVEAYFRTAWHLHPSSCLATTDTGRKLGGSAALPLGGGVGSTSNTMLPGLRPAFIPSGILIHPAVWPQETWAENWGRAPFYWRDGSPSNAVSLGPRPTSLPSGILIYAAIWPQRIWTGPKIGGLCPVGEGELGRHRTQCRQGRGLPACQVSS